MEEYLKFAKRLALESGKVMKEYFDGNFKISFKSDKTPVTEADKLINDYVISEVKKYYPDHSVDGEENKNIVNESKYVWVLDPIDGTSMFTRHVPISVFSLALVIDGEVFVGVVYDPFLDELYTAIKGEGAYCNGKKIHVNNLEYGVLGSSIDICMWNNAKYDTLPLIKEIRINNKTCQVGSTAHAAMLVAKGLISGEIFPGSTHGHCDMAASALIVSEAGGKVTDFFGNEQRYDEGIDGCILTNGLVHDKILELTRKNY